MPVDRSLLPPLPGKPDWYVEGAPRAIDPYLREALEWPELANPAQPPVRTAPAAAHVLLDPTLVPATPELAAPAYELVVPRADHGGRGIKKVKALAGRFRH